VIEPIPKFGGSSGDAKQLKYFKPKRDYRALV